MNVASNQFVRQAAFVLLLASPVAASCQAPAPIGKPVVPALVTPTETATELAALEPRVPGISSSVVDSGSSVPEPAAASLPDAPQPVNALPAAADTFDLHAAVPYSFSPEAPGQATPNIAPKLTKYIPSGWTAQTINGHDKVLIGLRDLYSPLNFLAMVASAGYEQAFNGSPNYGTDRGAFGQRLGAAAIRESTQGLFTDTLFAPIFHEDPRYYVQGRSHNFLYRAAYAATRPVITRTDSGGSSVNVALLAGYAASSALSYTYYPQINRNFHDTVSSFGGSLGGAAIGFAFSEFSDDLLKAVHLRKK